MKTITLIKLTLITLLASIILAGCGGSEGGGSGGVGSGGGGSSASFDNSNTVTTVASCTLPLASRTTVVSGDVVSATSGSQLKFDHDSSNNKKVCVVTGSATIL